ncbi:MAG: response regulator transcription factor [Oscillospiraceae bacterium]
MNEILIVEDEAAIANLIRISLTDAGYRTVCAGDGEEALSLLETLRPDLVLLDVMLPKLDGFALMEYIRPMEIPVIFLTAKADVNDKVRGLKLGAEDYLAKPFELVELLARVETVLRRYNKDGQVVELGGLVIDTLSRVVKKDDCAVALTAKEYDLLLLFVRNRGIALFRDRIYERVWGDFYAGDSRTIDLHVQRLRKKVGWEDRIVAVYKIGYRLEI